MLWLLAPTYAGRAFSHDVPKYRLPAEGMEADAAYQLVHDELNLDGNPSLNLASFVTLAGLECAPAGVVVQGLAGETTSACGPASPA